MISQFIVCWSTTSGGHIPQLHCSLHFGFVFSGHCNELSPCHHKCKNLERGGYECLCRDGYKLHQNGFSCIQIGKCRNIVELLHAKSLKVLKSLSLSKEGRLLMLLQYLQCIVACQAHPFLVFCISSEHCFMFFIHAT